MSAELCIVAPVRKWGKSYVLLLPKAVRELLGVEHRDLVGLRKCGRYIILKKLRAGELMPLSEEDARQEAARAGD